MTTAGQEVAGIETNALHRSASRGTAPPEPAPMAVTRSISETTSPLKIASSPITRRNPRRLASLIIKHAPPSIAPPKSASSRQSRRTAGKKTAAPGPGMGRKGISRDGDAKPVPGKPYLLREDGSRVRSKSSKGWDKDGKYEANKGKYQDGTLDTLQQDRRVQHAEEGGQLAIPDMITAMAREEGAEVYFSDHDGNNMVVFSLDAFAKLSDKVTYVHASERNRNREQTI